MPYKSTLVLRQLPAHALFLIKEISSVLCPMARYPVQNLPQSMERVCCPCTTMGFRMRLNSPLGTSRILHAVPAPCRCMEQGLRSIKKDGMRGNDFKLKEGRVREG